MLSFERISSAAMTTSGGKRIKRWLAEIYASLLFEPARPVPKRVEDALRCP
jgi:hypothetical protein